MSTRDLLLAALAVLVCTGSFVTRQYRQHLADLDAEGCRYAYELNHHAVLRCRDGKEATL